MKKSLIASLAVLACAAVVGTFALGGAGKFGDVQVNADPVEYSVTFDAESSHVGETLGNYVIAMTTPRGARVGVVGCDNSESFFTFNGASFVSLCLYDYDGALGGLEVYQFSYITGFAISFSGGSMMFSGPDDIIPVESGHEYKGLSIIPDDEPEFMTIEEDCVTVTSLTIWYSC